MEDSLVFYICPTCFYASEVPDESHEHQLLRVDRGLPGNEGRKPVIGRDRVILFPAPYWFYEALTHNRIVSSSNSKI